MRKYKIKMVKDILKKNEDLKGVRYEPTLEECDYLYKSGIATTVDTYKIRGIYTTWTQRLMEFTKE